MASGLQKSTMIYRTSINTPDFEDNDDWIINPDLSNVQGVPRRYWKIVNSDVIEMSTEEKAEVDRVPGHQQVQDAINFGKEIILEFGGTNVDENTPLAVTEEITKQLEPVTIALMTGTVTVALKEMKNVQSPYITEETKNYFINKIQNYIDNRTSNAGQE